MTPITPSDRQKAADILDPICKVATRADIAAQFGIKKSYVSTIRCMTKWGHGGYCAPAYAVQAVLDWGNQQ